MWYSTEVATTAAVLLSWARGGAALKAGMSGFAFPHEPKEVQSCPKPWSEAGPGSFRWSLLRSVHSLDACNETVLFDIPVHRAINENGGVNMHAAKTPDSIDKAKMEFGFPCQAGAKTRKSKADISIVVRRSDIVTQRDNATQSESIEVKDNTTSTTYEKVAEAAKKLSQQLEVDPSCQSTTLFAKSGGAYVGLYVGRAIRKSSAVPHVEKFIEYVTKTASSLPSTFAAQVCAPSGKKRSARHGFGIVADMTGDLGMVHEALGTWANATCIEGFETMETWEGQEFSIIPFTALTMGPRGWAHGNDTLGVTANSTASMGLAATASASMPIGSGGSAVAPGVTPWHKPSTLAKRAECRVYKAVSGDDCWKIATANCGLQNLDDLYRLNPDKKSSCEKGVSIGDTFCCSEGQMPDLAPKPNSDGTCKHVVLGAGDDCGTIPEDCGITAQQFYTFNGGGNDLNGWCSGLKSRGVYCCSPGKKPDLRPKKNADGSCAEFSFDGRFCYEIENEFFLEKGDIDKFNKGKTWGWFGCSRLGTGQKFCLSDGDPPMPIQYEEVRCGPQVFGTKRPASGTKLADLNPCPLNACCNVWGQCGTTDEYCTDTTIDNTPGTAKENTAGCISNCGTEIVNNEKPPTSFSRVAYFEAWNQNRECLHMDVTDIGEPFTHVHFAFGTIGPNFEISMEGIEDQFEKLKGWNTKIKKIVSFGGWAFSTEPETINIFRAGVLEQNREKFATNVANFIKSNGLDGVDFDWEYPGADDIPDTTPGTKEDGPNYLEFLKLVRQKLPDKSISIAAPASYWYLRWFPIDKISKVVDYIIYMTYDFHGSWDYSMKHAMPGCQNGDCLRSHVNLTETMNALSMITKAGVESRKVMVGVSSYGRSFKMAQPGCHGPQCKYVGEKFVSRAAKGLCTQTAGYLADAEINQIMDVSDSIFGGGYDFEVFHDDDADSDILVYDQTEWVAFMSSATKESRTNLYKGKNFAGTSDWAVDLSEDWDGNHAAKDGDVMVFEECDYGKTYDNLDALANDAEKLDPTCAAVHTLRVLHNMYDAASTKFDGAKDGYDGKFEVYRDYIKETLGAQLKKYATGDGAKYFKCWAKISINLKNRDGAREIDCSKYGKQRGMYESYTFWFEVKDKNAFDKALDEDLGIDPEWVMFGDLQTETRCQMGQGGSGGCLNSYEQFKGIPVPKPNFEVPDPKVMIEQAQKNFSNLAAEFVGKELELAMEQWDGSPEDAVQVLSVPVYMISDAVTSMEKVKEIGGQIQEAKKKDLILTIISSILMIIPFIGGAVGGLGRAGAAIARMVSAVEVAADAGLSIYELIDDPESAPMAIVGLVMGGAGAAMSSAKQFNELATLRKNMPDAAKAKMGATWKDQDPKVQNIMNRSCGRK